MADFKKNTERPEDDGVATPEIQLASSLPLTPEDALRIMTLESGDDCRGGNIARFDPAAIRSSLARAVSDLSPLSPPNVDLSSLVMPAASVFQRTAFETPQGLSAQLPYLRAQLLSTRDRIKFIFTAIRLGDSAMMKIAFSLSDTDLSSLSVMPYIDQNTFMLGLTGYQSALCAAQASCPTGFAKGLRHSLPPILENFRFLSLVLSRLCPTSGGSAFLD